MGGRNYDSDAYDNLTGEAVSYFLLVAENRDTCNTVFTENCTTERKIFTFE